MYNYNTVTIYLHNHAVGKPEIIQQPKDRREESMKTNVNLKVVAKGKSMKFNWVKHGDDSDDDMAISADLDDDQYRVTKSTVIEMAILYM